MEIQRFRQTGLSVLVYFDSVQWEKGTIEAISYDEQHKELSRHSLQTVGEPERLKLTLMHSPQGVFADGADIAMVQVEVVDGNGERCPLANHKIKFDLQGPAEWRGGIAQAADNYVLAKELPVECGITRVMIRSTTQPGNVVLKVAAEGLASEEIAFSTQPVEVKNGLSTFSLPLGCLAALTVVKLRPRPLIKRPKLMSEWLMLQPEQIKGMQGKVLMTTN